MPTIATSADGAYVFLALEDGSGNQVIVRAARSDLSTWAAAYSPGAGSAANVAMVPSNPDKMLFYGNFDTDVGVIVHTISTATNTDITPASLGANVINTLAVNPSDENELMCTVDTDQDLIYTADQGDNWDTLDAALGYDATALWTLWSGAYFLHRYFIAGQVAGPAAELDYSPNEGASSTDETGAMSVTDVVNVEVTEEAA